MNEKPHKVIVQWISFIQPGKNHICWERHFRRHWQASLYAVFINCGLSQFRGLCGMYSAHVVSA
jgi:hypothetical protein